MELEPRSIVVILAGGLLLAGCGKPQTGDQSAATESVAADVASEAQPPASATSPADTATNGNLSGAAEFARKSLASPFAQAELALKESYNRALIAFQIGDYPRAASELRDLANEPDLNSQQKQAVEDLLKETLKLAPELAAQGAAATTAKTDAPPVFPLASTDTPQAPQNLPASPFSTADPAIKESFARAKAAYDIGNYEIALAELQDLVTNSQLNYQQKYTIQVLLDKTPRSLPAAPATRGEQPPRR